MSDAFGILREFVIDEDILLTYPNVADLVEELVKLRDYKAWAIRTRCGDRVELDKLVPADRRRTLVSYEDGTGEMFVGKDPTLYGDGPSDYKDEL